MKNNTTLLYYSQNASEFIENTQNVNMSAIQNEFLDLLPPNAQILDFGCGSGRDSLAFLKRGFFVDAVDGCVEFCSATEKLTEDFKSSGKIKIKQLQFSEFCESQKYDGIWACSSLLHVPKSELSEIFLKIKNALKPDGIFYTSFKCGNFEGMRNGRYFSDFSETELCSLIEKSTNFKIIQIWQTKDVRPERTETWINAIFRKQAR